MASPITSRPAPFGAETTLSLVRFVERILVAVRAEVVGARFDAAVTTVPARALNDVGIARSPRLETRYSQVAARV